MVDEPPRGGRPEAGLALARRRQLLERLSPCLRRAARARPLVVEGRLTRMVGLTLEAQGCLAAVGDHCRIQRPGGTAVEAEVVGFTGDRLLLMPVGEPRGLAPGAAVIPAGRGGLVVAGAGLLGRVVDGTGRPLDGAGPITACERVPRNGRALNPLERRPIREPLDVGVRAINGLLTVGQGQRLGLFAPSGVGKSMLLGMMARFTNADVIVVGLIGERGREVQEFVTEILGESARARAVVVAAPASDPPLVRMHGAALATAVAEHFRDQGLRVLLLMDSLTRFALADREVSLAVGEPPATRGFPPSVFARLPQLVERAGNDDGPGGITAFYTVLTEPDQDNDPVADAARAILDGHVVMSRELAERGHFPAIDIDASISRAMHTIIDPGHQAAARRFRQLHAVYRGSEDLIQVGAYRPGSDRRVDEAVEAHPSLVAYLRQERDEPVSLAESRAALERLVAATAEVAS